jgi:hypothetical protein
MVQPSKPLTASWSSLPADVKRYAMQFIASSNVYEVVQTMKALNATNRFCHDAIQSEQVLSGIFFRMPYLLNRLYLLRESPCWPICGRLRNNPTIYQSWTKLENGEALLAAVKQNNQEVVNALLTQENIDFDYWDTAYTKNILTVAISSGFESIAMSLIKAGTCPNKCYGLQQAILGGNSFALIELLLRFGAAASIPLYPDCQTERPIKPEIKELILREQKKRKRWPKPLIRKFNGIKGPLE